MSLVGSNWSIAERAFERPMPFDFAAITDRGADITRLAPRLLERDIGEKAKPKLTATAAQVTRSSQCFTPVAVTTKLRPLS